MLTDQHIAEALSRAYVRAIAGRAGLNLAIREYDYGVDGSFDEVVMRQKRRVESGFSLSFQLKASTQWQLDFTHVIYDLEAKTYNDLVFRHSMRTATPCILILLALPNDSEQWLISTLRTISSGDDAVITKGWVVGMGFNQGWLQVQGCNKSVEEMLVERPSLHRCH